MSTATKGRAFEHEVRKLFESAGFSVTRGAGSKGEFFGLKTDLIATKLTPQSEKKVFLYLLGAQCKIVRKSSSSTSKQAE